MCISLSFNNETGCQRIELRASVLETEMLPLHQQPMVPRIGVAPMLTESKSVVLLLNYRGINRQSIIAGDKYYRYLNLRINPMLRKLTICFIPCWIKVFKSDL